MIRLDDITLARGAKCLFTHANLSLFAKQKIALIGANGSGKSSLFAMITGDLEPDQGSLYVPTKCQIAKFDQAIPQGELSALEYVMSGNEPAYKIYTQIQLAEAAGNHDLLANLYMQFEELQGFSQKAIAAELLNGLGFSEDTFSQTVNQFSGGWRMRIGLAKILNKPADLLMLDEPTNHLDMEAVLWLEQWLKQYSGTLLLISHDREFLDNIVTTVLHLHNQTITSYTGNYSTFESTRSTQLALQEKSRSKQQAERDHMQSFIDRFRYKASKSKQVQSRLKALSRLPEIRGAHIDENYQFAFPEPEKTGDPLLILQDANLGYQDQIILKNVNFSVHAQSRIGILGPNGAGKSTLMKCLAGLSSPLSGALIPHPNLKIGYFAQQHLEQLEPNKSPVAHIVKLDPTAKEQAIRTFLGKFGFSKEMALSHIAHFSGGEKSRLALALIVWQRPNLLLLDEPTNHLDIDMRTNLTIALQQFNGAVIIISHDRFLLRASCNDFLLLSCGNVLHYTGDLEDYQSAVWQPKTNKTMPIPKKDDTQNKKIMNEIKKIETQIDLLAAKLTLVEQQIAELSDTNPGDVDTLNSVIATYHELQNDLQALEKKWLLLSDAATGQ